MRHIDIKSMPKYKPRQVKVLKYNERFDFEKAKKIIHLCCIEFGITYNEMTDGERPGKIISEKKQIASFIAKEQTDISWSNLGRILNNTHANVWWMYKRIEGACLTEKLLNERILVLSETVKKSL